MPWRFFATRVHGDGTETLLATELPLTGARVSQAVTGPGGITGTVPVEVARLLQGGRPVLQEWSTAVYAEHDGRIVAAGLLGQDSLTAEGPTLGLFARGFTSYLDGLPYEGDRSWVGADPADLVRHVWAHAQSHPGGNLGMVVDDLATPVRVGTPAEEVEFTTGDGQDVAFTAGPYQLNWWSTHDLGRVIADLATATPLDWREEHAWDGEVLTHRLRLGYPMLGARRGDLRFVVGENVIAEPAVTVAEFASQVIVLGAGEGRAMCRGTAGPRLAGRLRRPVVIVDKSLTTHQACAAQAAKELAWRSGGDEVATLTVADHPNAPLGSWAPGDEVFVQGSGTGWAGGLSGWVRVLSQETDVDTATTTLQVARAGRSTQ